MCHNLSAPFLNPFLAIAFCWQMEFPTGRITWRNWRRIWASRYQSWAWATRRLWRSPSQPRRRGSRRPQRARPRKRKRSSAHHPSWKRARKRRRRRKRWKLEAIRCKYSRYSFILSCWGCLTNVSTPAPLLRALLGFWQRSFPKGSGVKANKRCGILTK